MGIRRLTLAIMGIVEKGCLMFTFDLQLFGGGSQTQTTNQTTNQSQSSNDQFQNWLNSIVQNVQNAQKTSAGTTSTGGTSGQTVSSGLQQGLAPVAGFYQNEMQNGLSPAVIQNAEQGLNQQTQQTINNALHTAIPGTNTAGLQEDLANQGIMAQAQLGSNLAAQNQGIQSQGAAGLSGIEQILNPLQNYFNQTGTQTGTETGTQSSTTGTGTQTGGTQSGTSQGTSNTQGTTTDSQQPSFGSLLGSLAGLYAGAATGGAAGAGGLGSILGGL